MTPIIGILASSMTAGQLGSYESIQTITVSTATAADVTFSNIPSTYKHLQIRSIGRTNVNSSYAQNIALQFNSDTGANYSYHSLAAYTGGYSATTSSANTSTNFAQAHSGFTSSQFTSGMFGVGVIDILDYKDTNKYTTVRFLCGAEGNSDVTVSTIGLSSGSWRNTNAITSIKVYSVNGDLVQYSHFALYGIKG